MSFIEHISHSLRMFIFDRKAIEHISENENSTNYGTLIVIIGTLISMRHFNMTILLIRLVSIAGVALLSTLCYHGFVKNLLADKLSGKQYFRYLSNSAILYWFTFIPVIGIPLQIFAGSWMMIFNVLLFNKYYGVPPGVALIAGGFIPFLFLAISVTVRVVV